MTEQQNQIIETIPEFLTHALELEEESVAHYHELADSMEVHNNRQVAELFRTLARYSEEHAAEVRQRAEGMELHKIAPWDFKWACPGAPESGCMEEADYLMTPCEALRTAWYNEVRGRDFYAHVAATTSDEKVRDLAEEMAQEEDGHVLMLCDWLARIKDDCASVEDDLDPPNIPE